MDERFSNISMSNQALALFTTYRSQHADVTNLKLEVLLLLS